MIIDVCVRPPEDECYLGDGVYAGFDGSQFVLRVPIEASADGRRQTIYLPPSVLNELVRYAKKIYGTERS